VSRGEANFDCLLDFAVSDWLQKISRLRWWFAEDAEVVVEECELGVFKIPPDENIAEVDLAGLRRIFVNNRLDVFLIFKANPLEFWEMGEIHFGFFTMIVQSSFLHP
jgi:hypothetical protein